MNTEMNNDFVNKRRGKAPSLWVQLWVITLVAGMIHLPMAATLCATAQAQEAACNLQ